MPPVGEVEDLLRATTMQIPALQYGDQHPTQQLKKLQERFTMVEGNMQIPIPLSRAHLINSAVRLQLLVAKT